MMITMTTSNITLTAAFTGAGSSSSSSSYSNSGNYSSSIPSAIQQRSIEFRECEPPTTNNTTTATTNDPESSSNCTKIREALRGDFPEIDVLCSDAYLESVASVPGRSLDYVIHHKVRRSLEWRRSYGVDALRNALIHFPGDNNNNNNTNAADADSGSCYSNSSSSNPVGATCTSGGAFAPSFTPQESHGHDCDSNTNKADGDEQSNGNGPTIAGSDNDDDNSSIPPNSDNKTIRESSRFVPTPELVEVCASGAFVVRDEELMEKDTDNNGDDGSHPSHYNCRRRLVVYADTSRLNWWQTGVKAGLQYHVLVLEQALERIRTENNKQRSNNVTTTSTTATTTDNDNGNIDTTEGRRPPPPLSESIVIFVDTTNLPRLPPPLSAPRGMLELMKKAYPGRIHRIYVGPVHPWLRKLYNYLASSLQPKTREKIVLLEEAPSFAKFGSSRDVSR